MDDLAAPWRALETADPPGAPAGSARRPLVLGGVAVAIVLGVIAFALAASSGSGTAVAVQATGRPAPSTGLAPGDAGADATLVVEVSGAVPHPGVYHLSSAARVGDAIAAAGGYGARVDAARAARELNLAAHLRDGDQVRVPSRDDPPPAESAAGSAASGGIVHLATATAAQLDALPGIGPVTAAKIIASRDKQRFAAIDDLRTRKLVGASAFDKIRDLITVP